MSDNSFFAVVAVIAGAVIMALILCVNFAPGDMERCGKACGENRLIRWSGRVFETKTPETCECMKPERAP